MASRWVLSVFAALPSPSPSPSLSQRELSFLCPATDLASLLVCLCRLGLSCECSAVRCRLLLRFLTLVSRPLSQPEPERVLELTLLALASFFFFSLALAGVRLAQSGCLLSTVLYCDPTDWAAKSVRLSLLDLNALQAHTRSAPSFLFAPAPTPVQIQELGYQDGSSSHGDRVAICFKCLSHAIP